MSDHEAVLRPRPGSIRRTLHGLRHPKRRGHGIRIVIALILLVATALPIERNSITAFETDVFRGINGLTSAINGPVSWLMQFGNLLAVPVVGLMVLIVSRRTRISLDFLLAGGSAWLLARVLKETVERGRPGDLLSDVILRDAPSSGLGYVSGHAAVAAALATIAASYLGTRGKAIVIAIAAVVAFSRVYVGAHLPLDVVGGAAMGWAVGSLVHFVLIPELTGADVDAVEA